MGIDGSRIHNTPCWALDRPYRGFIDLDALLLWDLAEKEGWQGMGRAWGYEKFRKKDSQILYASANCPVDQNYVAIDIQ